MLSPVIYIYLLAAVVLILLALTIYYNLRVKSIYRHLKKFLDILSSSIREISDIDIDTSSVNGSSKLNGYERFWDVKELINNISEQFKKNSKLIDTVLNNMSMGIMIVGNDKKIIKINASLLNLFHLENRRVIGENIMMVFGNAKLESMLTDTMKNKKQKKEDIKFYGNEDLYLAIETIPLEFEHNGTGNKNISIGEEAGKEINVLVLAENVTQEVEFSKLRSQFAANVSHEMRTPLTSIRGYLETTLGSGLKDKKLARKYLGKSLEEVDRLTLLIKDILDLSRIEYKRNMIFRNDIDLVEVLRESIDSLEFLANENDITVEFKHNKDSIKYRSDEELFRQLTGNIIENTMFYAGSGSRLKIHLSEDEKNIYLNFTDNGKGIAKEDLPYIFQRFFRGKSPHSLKRIGSGLGLSIVKHTVDLHSGELEVTSRPNIETSFKITLPKKIQSNDNEVKNK